MSTIKNESQKKQSDARVSREGKVYIRTGHGEVDISKIEFIFNFNNQQGIYLVGHHFEKDDQLNRFKTESIWETGYNDKYKDTINQIPEGAILLSKTKSIKSGELFINGFGIVTKNIKNGKKLKVKWKSDFNTEYVFSNLAGIYPATVQKIREEHIINIVGAIGKQLFEESINYQSQTTSFKYSSLQIQPDSLEVYLNAEIIATEFGNIIHNSKVKTDPTKPSQEDRFYGIFGKWGRGKTRFWNLLKSHLKNNYEGQYHFIDFHAWKYQDTPAVWAYLYEKFASEYYVSFKSFWKYPFQKAANLFQSFWLTTYRNPNHIFIFITSLIIFSITLSLEFDNDIWKIVLQGVPAVSLVYTFYKSFSRPLASTANKFIKLTSRKSFSGHLGLQHEMQEELAILLRAWSWWFPKNSKKTFVLFIDDIDRCEEKKVVQIVDSIRVMLNEPEIQKRLIVVAAIDERILSQAIRKKYEGFVGESQTGLDIGKLAAEYMDKLFIAGIKLSELTKADKKEIFEGYANPMVEKKVDDQQLEDDTNQPEDSKISETQTFDQSEDFSTIETIENEEQVQNSEFELTEAELTMLSEMVQNLNNATPRSIRGFLIKYRLSRNLADKLLQEPWDERNKYIANRLVSVMNFEPPYNYEDEDTHEQITQIISMVDYYYYNSTVIDS